MVKACIAYYSGTLDPNMVCDRNDKSHEAFQQKVRLGLSVP